MHVWVQRFLYRLLPLLVALGLLILVRVLALGAAGAGPRSVTITLGFLLLGAFISGHSAHRLGLPRITGYLLVGLLVGPSVTRLVTKDMLATTSAIEGIAVTLIALTAGGEIKVSWLRANAFKLAVMTTAALLLIGPAAVGIAYGGQMLWPFAGVESGLGVLVVSLVLGVVSTASSPTVAMAVIAENRAEGPFTSTVLGVTVLKDVSIIVVFATMLTWAKSALGGGDHASLGWTLTRELGGSVLLGLAVGAGVSLFLRYVNRDTPVFILAVCIAVSETSTAFHLERLLVALTAGFWVENVSRAKGETLLSGIERVSLPVYALFFAAAGAKVDLAALATMWPFALLLAGARAVLLWLSTSVGAALCGADANVRRYGWLGFVSQAGVTLALASIVGRAFPDWGPKVQTLVVAVIAIHELVGPVAFQWALRRVGEVGKG